MGAFSDVLQGTKVFMDRNVGFGSSSYGLAFAATHQAPDTVIQGFPSFDETKPTFLFRISSAIRRVVPRVMRLTQMGDPASDTIRISVAIDSADRFSAGGVPVIPKNLNTDEDVASVVNFLLAPTATAAGAGTRYVANDAMPPSAGASFDLDFSDAIILGKTSSLLIYTWAPVTPPSWFFSFSWVEEEK